jgi:hypothetical protein
MLFKERPERVKKLFGAHDRAAGREISCRLPYDKEGSFADTSTSDAHRALRRFFTKANETPEC